MAKKYKWWCQECGEKWKSNFKNEDACPNCDGYFIFWKKNKKKKKKTSKPSQKILDALENAWDVYIELADDEDVYEGSCGCGPNEACGKCPKRKKRE